MSVPYWRLSGFYFFYFATLGAYLPYWGLYLAHIGLNSLQIGNLSALLVATRLIAPTLWGIIADRSGKTLFVIQHTLFWGSLIFSGFLALKDYRMLVWLTVLFGFFWNASLPLYEAVTLTFLERKPHHYSRIRLWGSVGFIVSVLSLGWLFDVQPVKGLPLVILGLLGVNWLTTLSLPNKRIHQLGHANNEFWQVLKQGRVLAFFAVMMLLQVAHGPYYVFYSIYLQQLGYSATVTGFFWALGVLAEIVLFIGMRPLLTKYALKDILLFSFFLAIVRWLLIAWFADQFYLLLFAQLLHAASFGTAHIASIHLVQEYFGPCHQSKGQALYNSAGFGLGGMLGSIYSGYYWESYGPTFVYSLAALFCYIAFIITYYGITQENKKKI